MMSELARDFFSHNPAMAGPLIAMVLFAVVFLAAVYRAMRADRTHIEKMAHLALEGDAAPVTEEVSHG